jgi:predicted O-methyltransferase YrrM
MFKKLKKWAFIIKTKVNHNRTINSINKNSYNDDIIKLIRAFEHQIKNTYSDDEREALEKINSLREHLLTNQKTIKYREIGGAKDQGSLRNEIETNLGSICRKAASPKKWCEFQFSLIRQLKPIKCLELGTNLGISGSYILSALELNKSGFLVTLEGNSQFAKIAATNMHNLNFKSFEVVDGLFIDTLPAIFDKHKTFDYVFIDGHHDRYATIEYFQLIKPHLSKNAVVIFDDINWSTGMQEAWSEIISDPGVSQVIDFYKSGIIFYNSQNKGKALKHNLIL